MAYMNEGRTSKPRSSPMLLGILIGMVLGLAIAGGLAWYLQKSTSRPISPEKTMTEKLAGEIIELTRF